MAYSVYQTDCVVLGMRETQEHDFILRVFSPVFGYIRIIAKGTRKNTSKLRAHIQEYAVSRIAVVKGKEFFILTDIQHIFSFIQSKTVVHFLKRTEGLFFDDENDHGTQANVDIYTMLLAVCKLLVWLVSEKKSIEEVSRVEHFFTVYVKGLQGFSKKIDMGIAKDFSSEDLYKYICSIEDVVQQAQEKLAL